MNRFMFYPVLAGLLFPPLMAVAEESATVGELPSLQHPAQNSVPSVETSPSGIPSPAALPPSEAPAYRRMPSAEELEKLRKDKNWVVEGMKQKQSDAAALKVAQQEKAMSSYRPGSPDDLSQSIRDSIIQPNRRGDARQGSTDGTAPAAGTAFKPALATSAFQPLPSEMSTSIESRLPDMSTSASSSKNEIIPPQGNGSYSADSSTTGSSSSSVPSMRFSSPNALAVTGIETRAESDSPATLKSYSNAQNPVEASPASSLPALNQGRVSASSTLDGSGYTTTPMATAVAAQQQQASVARLRMQEEERLRMQASRPQVREMRATIPDPNDVEPF